jgi:hypothetical protein
MTPWHHCYNIHHTNFLVPSYSELCTKTLPHYFSIAISFRYCNVKIMIIPSKLNWKWLISFKNDQQYYKLLYVSEMVCTACLIHWFTYLFLVRHLSKCNKFLQMILKCHCLQIVSSVLLYAGLFSNHSPLYFTNTKRFFSKMGLACHIAKIHSEVIELKVRMQVFPH